MRKGLRAKLAIPLLMILCGALVLWVRLLPLEVSGSDRTTSRSPDWTYVDEDGREHVYLGDLDSYLWLRHARTLLRTGEACDAIEGGECRDTYTNAPVGARTHYARSLQVAALAGLHRLMAWAGSERPLPATALLLPVIVAVAGVVPAFLVGRLLGGAVAGVFAVVLTALEPLLLARTAGGDNDIWSVVLPLFALWFVLASLRATSRARCVGWAGLGGATLALHAWAWRGWLFFFVVLAATLASVLVLDVAREAWRAGGLSRPRSRAVGRGVLALGAFCVAAIVGAGVTPDGGAAFGALARGDASPLGAPELGWPSGLGLVAELRPIDLRRLTAMVGGNGVVLWAWLGIELLLLPRSGWRSTHRAVLGGALLCAGWLVRAGIDDSWPALLLVAVPLVSALLVGVLEERDETDRPSRAAAIALLLWFAGGSYAVYGGVRFYVLAAPPVGIACAVVVGRLCSALRTAIAPGPRWYRAIATVGLGMVLGLGLLRFVIPAYETARSHRPAMNDAWWDVLSRLRRTSPSDSIVYTWWDQGHWAAYVADRRVVNDGSSLQTHIPYWMSRALLASSEDDSVGVLRMLGCGPDALVARDASDPGDDLAEQGFTRAQQEELLGVPPCSPPEGYLVLTNRLLRRRSALVQLSRWDPRHPHDLTVRSGEAVAEVPLLPQWIPCVEEAGGTHVCPIRSYLPGGDSYLETFRYREAATDRGELVGARGERSISGAPALILIAGTSGLRRIVPLEPAYADLGVLIDPEDDRILVGAPVLLESTLVQLLFLDGRYATRYEKIDERSSAGERVTTWKIRWPDTGGRAALAPTATPLAPQPRATAVDSR